jgi:hypothetical protein
MLGWSYLPWQQVEKDDPKPGWWSTLPKHYHIKINRDVYKGRSHNDLRFNSDWNWLMEAVEFIENLSTHYYVYIQKTHTSIGIQNINYLKPDKIICQSTFDRKMHKKEAVFIVVSDFAKQNLESLDMKSE